MIDLDNNYVVHHISLRRNFNIRFHEKYSLDFSSDGMSLFVLPYYFAFSTAFKMYFMDEIIDD